MSTPRQSPPSQPKYGFVQVEEVYALWDALSKFPAGQTEQSLEHLMRWIAREIDADNVIWIGALRVLDEAVAGQDPFHGWRLRARRPMRPDPEGYRKQLASYYVNEHYGRLSPTYYERSHDKKEEAHIGMTGQGAVAGAGKFRVHRLRDGWIDYSAFRRTLHYKLYYQEAGIADRIWVGFPIHENAESFFLIDRFQREDGVRRKHFTLREATLAGAALRGIPEFHRRLFLGNGLLVGDKPLSPVEKLIVQGLLTDMSEKEIATWAGQRPATLHKYVKTIYARFGVQSRAALMSLWLGGR